MSVELIGRGSYGNVYRLKNNSNTSNYAIKRSRYSLDRSIIRSFLTEICFLSITDHPNILNLKDFKLGDKYIQYSMDLHPTNLQKLLFNLNNSKTILPTSVINKMLIDILSGLEYLHTNNIMHLDISDDNILLSENLKCSICDFGLSSIGVSEIKYHHSKLHDSKIILNYPVFKTPFASPEVLEENYYDFSSDIWAFGVLMHRVFKFGYIFKNLIRENQVEEINNYFEKCDCSREKYIIDQLKPREVDNEPLYLNVTDLTETHINIFISIFDDDRSNRPTAKQIKEEILKFETIDNTNGINFSRPELLDHRSVQNINMDLNNTAICRSFMDSVLNFDFYDDETSIEKYMDLKRRFGLVCQV